MSLSSELFSQFVFTGAGALPLAQLDEEDTETPTRNKRALSSKEEGSNSGTKAQRRQAAEEDVGDSVEVEVLCNECRRNPSALKQRGLEDFFGIKAATGTSWGRNSSSAGKRSNSQASEAVDLEADEISDAEPVDGVVFCNRCRRVMQEQSRAFTLSKSVTPSMRLKTYKRVAGDKEVAFQMRDSEALALMFQPCKYCGQKAPDNGHGITRLHYTDEVDGPKAMGPYSKDNTATACSHCNLAKGYHSEDNFVMICRHIASHQRLGDFGLFPECFRDNVSRKSRSCYLTGSKTHALTNEQFREIVTKPCFYCGKESGNGHFNGLDRLDSTLRVYTRESCVACCGTCNIMKYRWSVQEFLDHCQRVAAHAVRPAAQPDANIARKDDVICLDD